MAINYTHKRKGVVVDIMTTSDSVRHLDENLEPVLEEIMEESISSGIVTTPTQLSDLSYKELDRDRMRAVVDVNTLRDKIKYDISALSDKILISPIKITANITDTTVCGRSVMDDYSDECVSNEYVEDVINEYAVKTPCDTLVEIPTGKKVQALTDGTIIRGGITLTEVVVDAWSATGGLLKGGADFAGCGLQDAGLSFGGYNRMTNTEKFNGSAWSATGNLLTGRTALAGCGLQDSGLSFGGSNNTHYLPNTEKFNGSTWSNTGNLLTSRSFLAGCGLQDSGLSFGGDTSVVVANTEKFNGSTWSATGNLLTARSFLAGCGLQDAGLSFGGNPSTNTEKFNGSTWTNTGNLLLGRFGLAGCGLQDSGLSFGGNNGPTTEKFNGSTWSNTGNLLRGREFLAGCGLQDSGLSFGGNNTLPNTEKFTGVYTRAIRNNFSKLNTGEDLLIHDNIKSVTKVPLFNVLTPANFTWSMDSNLLLARSTHSGNGSYNNALVTGGQSQTTELSNGNVWKASINIPTLTTFYSASCGKTDATLLTGGTSASDNNVPVANSYKFSGVAWSAVAAETTLRAKHCMVGLFDSCYTIGNVTATTSIGMFNGTAWSTIPSLSVRRLLASASGTTETILVTAGSDTGKTGITEEYNGITWSTVGNGFPGGSSNVDVAGGFMSGTISNSMYYGGSTINNASMVNTYAYNGNTWYARQPLNIERQYHSGHGSGSLCLASGGLSPASSVNTTERYTDNNAPHYLSSLYKKPDTPFDVNTAPTHYLYANKAVKLY